MNSTDISSSAALGAAVATQTGPEPLTGEPAPHRSKFAVAVLAALLGVVGGHWWYLGRRWAWLVTAVSCVLIVLAARAPVWWDSPPFLLLFIPLTEGFVESLIFSLKPDEKFDARYNPGSGRRTATRWGPVVVAILVTLVGSAIVIFGISLTIMHVYIAMGWLDGLNL